MRSIKEIDAMSESEAGMTSEGTSRCTSPGLEATALKVTLSDEVMAVIETTERVTSVDENTVNGTYYVEHEERVAVAKPADEEAGMAANPNGNGEESAKNGFTAGKGYIREYLAYHLRGTANVPETVVMDLPESVFGRRGNKVVKASVQRYVQNDGQSWDCGPALFDVEDCHRIAILDLRVLNCDRHGGNILIRKEPSGTRLVPIDHGYTFPCSIEDLDFEWQLWKQVRQPLSEESLQYINSINIENEVRVLVEAGLEKEAIDLFRAANICLKIAANKGLNLYEIASFYRRERINEPSGLELLISECRNALDSPSAAEIDFERLEHRVAEILPGNWRDILH
eukprot:TRINITY_DN13686_c0_g1_i1.p1 TRINITY_DN13686_c0_g1~~TRINITY_DN13686_c0_g1_i1.p1  ORF type:complete len:362 (+),score=134.41 TRINITY_DN13686_c0_g1_i1:66-1088(+)